MNKKKILSAVTLLTIATSSTIGMNAVFATKGNVQDIDKCVYFALEDEEKCLTSEKLKELLESKGFTLKTELTGNVGTGTQIQVIKDGIIYEYIVVLLGDVNGDGKISTQDISMLRKHMIGSEEITNPMILKAMNVDGDKNNKISTQDVSRLRKMLIGSEVAIIPAQQMPDSKKDVAVKKLAKLSEYTQTDVTDENYNDISLALQDAKEAVEKVDQEVVVTLEGYENIATVENNINEYEQAKKEVATSLKNELDTFLKMFETSQEEENEDYLALKELAIQYDSLNEMSEYTTWIEDTKTKLNSMQESVGEILQAKIDAIDSLSAYKVENYDEEDWNVIDSEINDAKEFITTATTIDEIEGCLDETKSVIDAIKTKQEKLEEAIEKAKIELEEELGKYTSTDYETVQWNNMTSIINTAKESLENLKTSQEAAVADVDKIVDDVRTSLKAIETKLAIAQKQAIEKLDEILSDEGKRAQYKEENWNKIKDIVNSAKELINNYSSTSNMSTDIENVGKIEEDTFYEINSVLTLEKELANLKADKINDINSIATDTSKYSQQEQDAIANLKSNAEVAINGAQSFEEVEEKANEILAELSKYRTKVQKDAIDEINNKYVETDYYSEDWSEMIEIINNAKLAIDRALDSDVQTILSALDNDLSRYETISLQLENAINAAKAELETIYSDSNKANYEEEVWNALKEELASQETIIEGQTTKTKVTIALENAKNKLKSDFKTIAQQTEIAKQNALKQIDDAFASYVQTDYSKENWEILKSYVAIAKEEIDANDVTISAIETALQTAIEGMESVLTIAKEELNTAIKNAIDAVNVEYRTKYKNAYETNSYDDNEIMKILLERKEIETLTLIEDVNAKRDDIITRMANVKKTAQKELEQEFADNYDQADYYASDWEKIEKIVSDAINKIKEATTATDASNIKDVAISDINSIQKKEDTLETAKNNAISALEIYEETDYEETDWNAINTIITDVHKEIENALTPSAVTTIKDRAIQNIEKYETSLQKAKKEIETISNNNVEIEVQIIEGQTQTWCQANSIRDYLNQEITTKKIRIKTITKINDNTFAVNLCNVEDNTTVIDTVNFTCMFKTVEDEI